MGAGKSAKPSGKEVARDYAARTTERQRRLNVLMDLNGVSQRIGRGTWDGCVYDVDAVIAALDIAGSASS